MPQSSNLQASRIWQIEQKREDNWFASPSLLAQYLSRGRWKPARHLDLISDEVTAIADQPVFLIVTIPPRHGKSQLISHWTPIWFLKRWPWKRVLLVSYQAGFAADWGGTVKNTITENTHELDLGLSMDTRSKSQWMLRGHGGGMFSTGVMGAITGRGADLAIIDDPIKSQKEALSQTYRESIKNWYRSTFRTRLQPGASIILLMTRWHEDDLAGWLVTESEDDESDLPKDPWKIINLRAVSEGPDDDPLGRPEGAALWPEMYDLDALARLREAVGPYWWSAEFQGQPRPEGGAIVKEAWFGYYGEREDPLDSENHIKVLRCMQFWDTAFKENQAADRTACVTLVETSRGYFIVDAWAGRAEFPELVAIMKAKYSQYIPDRVMVEDKASGISAIQQLRRDTKIPILALKAKDDKTTRLNAVSGIIEAGRVFLPTRAPWLVEFLHEVCTFPAATHDDITDAFVYALLSVKPRQVSTGRGAGRRGEKQSIWRERR